MIAPLLERNPDLLHAFEEGASKAQALIGRTVAARVCGGANPNVGLLDRIRIFFNAKEVMPAKKALAGVEASE
jgi:hypothetical protein